MKKIFFIITCFCSLVVQSQLTNTNGFPTRIVRVNVVTTFASGDSVLIRVNGLLSTISKADFITAIGGGGGGGGGIDSVTSVFGRTGAVVAVSGDYSITQITGFPSQTSNTGKLLLTDGSNLSWGVPGADGQVYWNNAGVIGATNNFYWYNAQNQLILNGQSSTSAALAINRDNTAAYDFMSFASLNYSGAGMHFGDAVTTGYMPMITLQPDGTYGKYGLFIVKAPDNGSDPAFVIDARTTSNTVLTTQDLFGVVNAGIYKYRILNSGVAEYASNYRSFFTSRSLIDKNYDDSARNKARDSVAGLLAGKVDTVYRTAGKDSIIFKINGVRYAIKDSTGGGGGIPYSDTNTRIATKTDVANIATGSIQNVGNGDTLLKTIDANTVGVKSIKTLSSDAKTVTDTTITFNIASGTYQPTASNLSNVASSTMYSTVMYSRVGSVVTVSGKLTITPSASGQTSLDLTLPVATANFTSDGNAAGTGMYINGSSFATAKIVANSSAQTVKLIYRAPDTALADFFFTFQYTIQ